LILGESASKLICLNNKTSRWVFKWIRKKAHKNTLLSQPGPLPPNCKLSQCIGRRRCMAYLSLLPSDRGQGALPCGWLLAAAGCRSSPTYMPVVSFSLSFHHILPYLPPTNTGHSPKPAPKSMDAFDLPTTVSTSPLIPTPGTDPSLLLLPPPAHVSPLCALALRPPDADAGYPCACVQSACACICVCVWASIHCLTHASNSAHFPPTHTPTTSSAHPGAAPPVGRRHHHGRVVLLVVLLAAADGPQPHPRRLPCTYVCVRVLCGRHCVAVSYDRLPSCCSCALHRRAMPHHTHTHSHTHTRSRLPSQRAARRRSGL
jgi:hypothetical protein